MPILPSKVSSLDDKRDRYQLDLCKRDYNLLQDHNPEILRGIEEMVAAGATPEMVRRWTKEIITDESLPVQRAYNAARYVEAMEVA